MPVKELDRLLEEAAAEVLETMFFTCLAEEREGVRPLEEPLVCARVAFRGTPSGRLWIRVGAETGRVIAANFLGLDACEVSDARMGEVLCELSNMVCGAVLSRIERDSVFELRQPEIEPSGTSGTRSDQAIGRRVVLEEGAIEIWFEPESD